VAYLKPEQIEEIEETRGEILPKYNRLLMIFGNCRFKSDQAGEYARHRTTCIGATRRAIPTSTAGLPAAISSSTFRLRLITRNAWIKHTH